jgi:signal transduction histidine kinase
VARSYPNPTFRETLRAQLGSGLFFVIFQSAVIGMFMAFLISIWFVRWVTKPLVNIALGATRLAQGDYSTRVPISGPQETQIVALAFNDMASRVEMTQQAQRDFLANVSHDLRTPLTSIQGFAQAISEGVAEPQVAEIIHSEASRLNRMVNDLLDLARIQAGRMDMLRKAVQIDILLNSVGKSLGMKAEKQGVHLQLDIPELPRVAGDGDRLAQVFTNLVDNAIKHTSAGGQVRLRAALDEASKGVVVVVQDTGEGIPAADLPRIFERFYQVDKSRAKSSGTGLGLAITAEIIYAHNGKIWVESEYGQGARFTVWLPQPIGDSGKTVLTTRLG